MNETEFNALLANSKYRQLDDSTWLVVTAGSGGLGTKSRRSQRYYKLTDGLVYAWWRLTLEPPAVFLNVDAERRGCMLAEMPDARTLVDAIWNESVHT